MKTLSMIVATLSLNFFVQSLSASCSIAIPGNLKLRNQTSCSLDASWNAVSGAYYYKVKYKASNSGTWIYSGNISGTSITLYGLASNTTYQVCVASFCSNNTSVGYSSAVSSTTKKCSVPASISVSFVTSNSAIVSWAAQCGSNNFNLQYRKQGVSTWTKITNINTSTCTLSNLSNNKTYQYQVQANCGTSKSAWSSIGTFTTSGILNQRNILLVVLDDARYDAFIPNGAPSWFKTPAINSIAAEGANFRLMIPTTSQCEPSRASIYTGVYGHLNGVFANGDTINSSLPLVQQVLQDHGYYTGFIGKYGQNLHNPKGFNWWATSSTNSYVNPPYLINGRDTTIPGHISDVYPQLAKTFLNSVPAGKNFVLFYFTRVPHDPTTPRPQDSLLYVNDTMPFPVNNQFYTTNYPSFYASSVWDTTASGIDALELATYQTLKGADDNVDSLKTWINQRWSVDSTLIIITSDNGYLMGEHEMDGKILGLEESIRVPLFIRYPGWFGPNTVITDEIASTIDITNTLLDFEGISNSYNFQGLSLHQLANGEAQRKSFLYEAGPFGAIPTIRAVRTLTGMFIHSYCTSTTEEYYDLVADPREDSNRIFSSSEQAAIVQYRVLLDSLRAVYNDIHPSKKSCSLNGQRIMPNNSDESLQAEMIVSPNPAVNSFTFYFNSSVKSPATISISDELGHNLWRQSYTTTLDLLQEIDCRKWSNGFYFVKAEQDGKIYGRKILVQQ